MTVLMPVARMCVVQRVQRLLYFGVHFGAEEKIAKKRRPREMK
jgi:hypothetical protein